MTQDTYRFAYEEANAELRVIVGQFEQLRQRKEQIEQVVEALRPLVASQQMPETVPNLQAAPDAAPFLVQASPDVLPDTMPESAQTAVPEPTYAAEQSSDPFQRRIDNALKHGFAPKDPKILSLGLNGLLSRA